MKITEILLIFFMICVTLGFTFFYQSKNSEPMVCFENNCFSVEIADDVNERTKGLMFRENMDKDRGMFFIFEQEGVYPFWMKDTILPLDIIWMNSEREIVFIKENAEPYNIIPINPEKDALYVLEINAGESNKIGLKVGQVVSFRGR
jgi:uncharacterized membrane protein (UPF0127 family)